MSRHQWQEIKEWPTPNMEKLSAAEGHGFNR